MPSRRPAPTAEAGEKMPPYNRQERHDDVAGRRRIRYGKGTIAGVAELADAQVLGACGEIRVGSSPSARILCLSTRAILGLAVGWEFVIFSFVSNGSERSSVW